MGGILEKYPDYEARFSGVGFPPAGPSPEGPCSQVKRFVRHAASLKHVPKAWIDLQVLSTHSIVPLSLSLSGLNRVVAQRFET